MNDDKVKLEELLLKAKNSDKFAREQLIAYFKNFIINIVGNVCNRYVTWSDDEASIGLLAFNRAIDLYDTKGGSSFLNYTYLLVKRDLIDFYRREKKYSYVYLADRNKDGEDKVSTFETNQAIDSYLLKEQSTALVEEILELEGILNTFDICYEELEEFSPKHNDTRETLFEMAEEFIKENQLVSTLLNKKRVPITLFAEKIGYGYKTIERYRKYLTVLIIMKLNPQWTHLSQYLNGSSRKEG